MNSGEDVAEVLEDSGLLKEIFCGEWFEIGLFDIVCACSPKLEAAEARDEASESFRFFDTELLLLVVLSSGICKGIELSKLLSGGNC